MLVGISFKHLRKNIKTRRRRLLRKAVVYYREAVSGNDAN